MVNPLVSILIPTFNRKHYLEEVLSSALEQSYQNIEIIVVDNASDDGSYDLLKSQTDPRLKIFRNDKNLGPVGNWFRCLEESQGDYIKFLFSDDRLSPLCIEKMMGLFNEGIGFVYSSVILFDDHGGQKIHYRNDRSIFSSQEFLLRSLLGDASIPQSPGCALFRRKDIEKNLLRDIPNRDELNFPRYGAGNDLLLFLLTGMDYTTIAHVTSPLAYFRAHDLSLSCAHQLDLYYAWAKYFVLEQLDDPRLWKAFKVICRFKRMKDPSFVNISQAIEQNVALGDYWRVLKSKWSQRHSYDFGRQIEFYKLR